MEAGRRARPDDAMKTLYLLRHAKSSWDNPGLSDKQRPLASRGRKNAPEMGKRFAARGESVDQVVSSPAKRALTTAQLFCEACGYSPDRIETDEDLYFLGAGSIEGVILNQDDAIDALMLVFHNPDITYFSNAIDDRVRIDNVPTAGLVRFSCEVDTWRDWSRDGASFDYFDYPKNSSGDVITG